MSSKSSEILARHNISPLPGKGKFKKCIPDCGTARFAPGTKTGKQRTAIGVSKCDGGTSCARLFEAGEVNQSALEKMFELMFSVRNVFSDYRQNRVGQTDVARCV